MVGVAAGPGGFKRQRNARTTGKGGAIPASRGSAGVIPFGEMPEFDRENRRLNRVEPGVVPLDLVAVLDHRTPIPEEAELQRERLVVRGHRPAVAKGAEVL